MQSGQVIRRGNSWSLRYWTEETLDGQTRRHVSVRRLRQFAMNTALKVLSAISLRKS